MITLEDYFKALQKHDWYFKNSDDHTAFKNGHADRQLLDSIAAREGGKFKEMLHDFNEHYFTGQPWGTIKAPKPKLEGYLKAVKK